jgi:hypothetical protein
MGDMDEIEVLREKAKKCVTPTQIADLIEQNSDLMLRTVRDRNPEIRVNWNEILTSQLVVRGRLFKFSNTIPGWRGSFQLMLPTGIGFGKIRMRMLELLPIRVLEDISPIMTVELNAHDWPQMLMYRRLMEIDIY